MANPSSILAWKIPWTEEPGWLQSMGSQRVGYDWATNSVSIWIKKIKSLGSEAAERAVVKFRLSCVIFGRYLCAPLLSHLYDGVTCTSHPDRVAVRVAWGSACGPEARAAGEGRCSVLAAVDVRTGRARKSFSGRSSCLHPFPCGLPSGLCTGWTVTSWAGVKGDEGLHSQPAFIISAGRVLRAFVAGSCETGSDVSMLRPLELTLGFTRASQGLDSGLLDSGLKLRNPCGPSPAGHSGELWGSSGMT